MSDDVEVKFGATTGDLDSGIAHVKEKINEVREGVAGFAEGMKAVGEAILAAFAVEKIAEFVEKMAELGTQTERTMAVLGVSAKEAGELSLIAGMTGSSLQGMTMSMQRLQTNLQTASDPASKTGKALAAIGLSAKDLVGIPIPDQMNKIADGLSKFADGGNKTAIAMALLGRGAAGMLTATKEGSAGLDLMRVAGEFASVSLTEKTVKSLTDVHKSSVTLGAALNSLGATIVAAFGESLVNGINNMSALVGGINALIQTGQLWNALVHGMKYIWDQFIQNLVTGGTIIMDVLSLNWGEINAHWKEGLAAQETLMADHHNTLLMMAAKAKLQLAMVEKFSAEKEDKKQAPAIDMGGGGDGAAIAAKEIESEIKVLQIGLQEKKAILDQDAATYKITQAQKFQSLQDWTDDTYGTEKELLASELALYAQGTTQYAAVKAKMLELDAKYALDSQKITNDAVKAQQKSFQDMFNAVQTAFNSQLRGLLAGTTSWSQALKSILGDLIIAFIQAVEKMGFEWLAGELARTVATETGVAARTGAEVSGATVSSAANFASIFKSIMASAAQTFAGIFGFLSPVMGPAAAAPAVAGEATVAAAAAAIPALDVGTPWVASSGLAMIHKGEAIVPASVNGAWQDGLGGGGDTHHHWNIQALDARSFASMLKDNSSMINKILFQKSALTPGRA